MAGGVASTDGLGGGARSTGSVDPEARRQGGELLKQFERWLEAQRLTRAFGEHAIEHQGVEVDVEIEAPAEPLDDCHAAGLAAAPTAPPRAPAVEGEQGARVDPEHGAAQVVIPGQEVAQTVGQVNTHWRIGTRSNT